MIKKVDQTKSGSLVFCQFFEGHLVVHVVLVRFIFRQWRWFRRVPLSEANVTQRSGLVVRDVNPSNDSVEYVS